MADLELVRAEVDERSVFQPGGAQVAEDLRVVLVDHRLGRLEFKDVNSLDHDVGEEFSDDGAVLVENGRRLLLFNVQTLLAETMRTRCGRG